MVDETGKAYAVNSVVIPFRPTLQIAFDDFQARRMAALHYDFLLDIDNSFTCSRSRGRRERLLFACLYLAARAVNFDVGPRVVREGGSGS